MITVKVFTHANVGVVTTVLTTMMKNMERTLMIDEIKNLRDDNTRAWERVATLEKQLKECTEEINRISEELARSYE